MGRPVTSDVSALSGYVANGHQAVHHVSSPPSKIPYGGFSPVRLQTGVRPRPSPPSLRRLIRGPSRNVRSIRSCSSRGATGTRRCGCPIQRSLARQPVMLSGRVPAYYDLIRGSGPFSPASLLAGCRRVFAGQPRPRASLIYSACPSFRAVFLTPAGQVVVDCSNSTRGSLRPVRRGSAPAIAPRTSRFTRGVHFRGCKVRFMLRPGKSLAPHRHGTFTSKLSSPRSPDGDVGYNYAGKQSIPATGLPPVGHAALQAALELRTSNEKTTATTTKRTKDGEN